MARAPCASCGLSAQFREVESPHTLFCTFLCQRKFHGVSGRALTEQRTDSDHAFFDARNVSLWLRHVALFPDVSAVLSAMEEPWPTAAYLATNVLRPRDTTNLESGASGAEMYAATYIDGARHVPFLSKDAVVLMKSVRAVSGDDFEMRMAVTEACTGARVGALYYAGISRAFVPVIDAFPVVATPNLGDAVGVDNQRFFVVQPFVEHAADFDDVLREDPANVVAASRSFIAQVLCALEAGAHAIGFTHYDLHLGNILAEKTHVVSGEVWAHTRPQGRTLYFDPSATDNRVARIIDFGLSRANHPRGAGTPTYLDAVHEHYDAHIDMRMFAYAFIGTMSVQLVRPVTQEGTHEARAVRAAALKGIRGCGPLMRVLENMLGLAQWERLHGEYAFKLSKSVMAGREHDVDTSFKLPASALDLSKLFEDVGSSRMWPFVRQEISAIRTDDATAPTIADILDDRFFAPLYTRPTEDAHVVSLGDARKEVPV